MRFRAGLVIGLGVGYVLGTKAGQERYKEIEAGFRKFTGNAQVRQAAGKGRSLVDTSAGWMRSLLGSGLRAGGQRIGFGGHNGDS